MEQNKSIVYESIDGTGGRYRWKKYLNIRVIEDTTNGYINATKLCAMYGKTRTGRAKKFSQWKQDNQSFIDFVSSCVHRTSEEIVPQAVIGGKVKLIRGTYVHPDLFVKIASWCSDEFGYKVYRIINSHNEAENRMLMQGKDSVLRRMDELMVKIDSVVEGMKIQSNEMKVQTDALKAQSDALKVQTDALKIRSDGLKVQTDGLHSTLCNVFNTVTSIEDVVGFKAD